MILIKMSCPWGGGIFLEGMGEPFFGGDGQNLWGKPGVKIIGGGALSLVSRKKYAVGGRNLHSTLHILLENFI